MNEDGSVNLSKIDEIVEEQIEGGVAAIVSCGTTGEGSTLSRDEHVEVMRHTIKAVNHRIPVIAGTEATTPLLPSSFPKRPRKWVPTVCCLFRLIITSASHGLYRAPHPYCRPSQYSDTPTMFPARHEYCLRNIQVLSAHKNIVAVMRQTVIFRA